MIKFTEDTKQREYFSVNGIIYVTQAFNIGSGYIFKPEGDSSYEGALGDQLMEVSVCKTQIMVRYELRHRSERAMNYEDSELRFILEDCVVEVKDEKFNILCK